MANGTFTDKANFIWTVADLIRDDFKRGKYQDVILPLTVLRRIDCVLEPTKEKVLSEHAKYKDKLKDLDPVLRKASGFGQKAWICLLKLRASTLKSSYRQGFCAK